jgi:phenylpropionate dioxygenase-like ring-hydroxylating dioxygenase large terminal subunit
MSVMQPYKTQPLMQSPETPEELLKTGLLNMWYLVAPSSEVHDRPVGLKRLNRNLVLWRDAGKLHVIEDYCPHRGAPLSLGRIVNGNVACAYHGLELNGSGCIVAVPPTPDCSLIGREAVKSYPSREHAGAIFVYFSDDAHASPPEPIFPEEIVSDEWSTFLFTTEWKCNWQITLDNRTDPVHGSYLHTDTFTLANGRRDAELKVDKTDHGFETYRTNQRGVNLDWHEVEFHPDNIMWVRTEAPYPASFGGGSFRINGHPTPIDADTTYVWFFRSRKISGWQRDMWRFLYKNKLEARAFTIVEQDRVMLERIPLEARQRESLIQTDIAVGRMRRLLREEASRQLKGIQGSRSRQLGT